MNKGIISFFKRPINCINKIDKYYTGQDRKVMKKNQSESWKCKIKLLKYERIDGKNCRLHIIEERVNDSEDDIENSNIIYHREIKGF